MGITVQDETRDKIGEQLLQLAKRLKPDIQEQHWDELGSLHKGDYMPYIDGIVAAVENQPGAAAAPVESAVEAPAVAESFGSTTETAPEPPEPAPAAEPVAITPAESGVLANTDLGEGVNISKPPPLRPPEPTTDEVVTCSDCGKVCKSAFGLQAHRRSHKTEPVPA